MNRILTTVFSCIVLSALFVCSQVFAEDAGTRKIYKFKYNTVPLKQPVVTQSMKPAVEEYNKGNYLGAMVELKKIVEQEEKNSYAKYYLALCYAQLGYDSEAQEMFNKVIEQNDNYSLVYYSKMANECSGNSMSEICKPAKKHTPPDVNRNENLANKSLQNGDLNNEPDSQDDDITRFIKSGKKIHPYALDRINNERMIRKLQAEEYLRKHAEEEARNQTADGI